jgi:F-type H+-transporting ATPase subunit b
MLIDWFTVAAQAVNFVVLVWLLKRFLYKPILSTINKREQFVTGELADAARQKAEAQQAVEDLSKRNKAFDDERAGLLAAAVADAARERDRLLASSRLEADALQVRRQSLLQNERVALNDQLTRLASAEVFAVARRALKDLAGMDLEARMAEILAQRLREMTPETKALFAAAIKGPAGGTVRSRFELPAQSRATIEAAVKDCLSPGAPLRFETAPDGICGIELLAQGQKLSWNIAEYLKALEGKVDALIPLPVTAAPVIARAAAS